MEEHESKLLEEIILLSINLIGIVVAIRVVVFIIETIK
jgi:hypothetical protein